jgi:hypothetical protein
MGLENPLGLVLWQAAMELTAAVDTLESRGTKLGHTRAVYPVSPDVLGRLQERRQQADRVQDFEGTRLAVWHYLSLNQSHAHSVAGELAGSEQSGRAGANNQNVVLRHSITSGRHCHNDELLYSRYKRKDDSSVYLLSAISRASPKKPD